MIEINLQPVPNQSFSFTVGETTFDITLKTSDALVASVTIDSVVAMQGVRVMAYRPVLPYAYLTKGAGNLFFITDQGEEPSYEKFGVTQSLVWASEAEIEGLVNVY